MKGAEEGDDAGPAGVPARELEGGLEGFGAAVGEEDAARAGRVAGLGQALRQVDLRLVVEVGAGHVQQLVALVGDGGDDLGMAMARRGDGDAGREVEEEVAVHVLDDRAAAALDDQGINPRVRGGHVPRIPGEQLTSRRAGQLGLEAGHFLVVEKPHGRSLSSGRGR